MYHQMGCHIKQQEIALLRAQHPFVDEALRGTLAHLLELEADLEDGPGFTCEKIE
jgi:hypothetical protein